MNPQPRSAAAGGAEPAVAPRPQARWRKNPRRQFHWLDWGGDSVVFELRSGHTYQFAPMVAAVMACFEEQARSVDELAAAIGSDLGIAADNELRLALVAIVEQLSGLGWIEPIDRP